MDAKRCPDCNEERPVEEFSWKNKAKGLRQSYCKKHQRARIKKHYDENTQYYVEKAVKHKEKHLEKTYRFVLEHLQSNPCVDCGISDPMVLTFDHVRGKKKDAVSQLVKNGHSVETIKQEIDKCEVRCWNCHMRRTRLAAGWRDKSFLNIENAPVAQLDRALS